MEAADTTFIKKGRTTKAQLVKNLGEPTNKTQDSSGKETWIWYYSHGTIDAKSYIPIVGFFVGGGKQDSRELDVTFDKHGVVSNYQFSSGTTTGGFGVN